MKRIKPRGKLITRKQYRLQESFRKSWLIKVILSRDVHHSYRGLTANSLELHFLKTLDLKRVIYNILAISTAYILTNMFLKHNSNVNKRKIQRQFIAVSCFFSFRNSVILFAYNHAGTIRVYITIWVRRTAVVYGRGGRRGIFPILLWGTLVRW